MEIPSTYDSSTLESRTLRQWGSGSAPRQNPNLRPSSRRSASATSWGRQYSKKLGSRLHASCPHPPLDVESLYVSCSSVTGSCQCLHGPRLGSRRRPRAGTTRHLRRLDQNTSFIANWISLLEVDVESNAPAPPTADPS